MIKQKYIIKKAKEWGVCPDFETVWYYLKENLFQKLKLL